MVILRVNYFTKQRIERTELLFVVTRQPTEHKLGNGILIDPDKIKQILGTQLAPLSRILGNVHIEKLRLFEIDRRKSVGQNKSLITILGVIFMSLAVCYAIACFKVCR